VDRQLCALVREEDNDLERVPSAIRPDDEPAVRIFSGILDGERMVDCVADVFVDDAVLACRRMDLHEDLVYYENGALGGLGDLLLAKTPLARQIQR
jgi:hypothetical protein